jgi:hypothetical protein
MTTFNFFCANCKIRHDFGDQIQVRYRHTDGEEYDTWVSGEEVLARLRSEAAEERVRGLRNLNWRQIEEAKKWLPDEAKKKTERTVLDILGDNVEETIGGNIIGDSVADAVRGRSEDENTPDSEKERWLALMQNEMFRVGIFELAWIQLEGSFPEDSSTEKPDDWL